ncbi:MAG TPA: hypothetical protein VIN11_00645 [Roseivirga sp.]
MYQKFYFLDLCGKIGWKKYEHYQLFGGATGKNNRQCSHLAAIIRKVKMNLNLSKTGTRILSKPDPRHTASFISTPSLYHN